MDVNKLPVLPDVSPLIQSLNDKAPNNKIHLEYGVPEIYFLPSEKINLYLSLGENQLRLNFGFALRDTKLQHAVLFSG